MTLLCKMKYSHMGKKILLIFKNSNVTAYDPSHR